MPARLGVRRAKMVSAIILRGTSRLPQYYGANFAPEPACTDFLINSFFVHGGLG